MAKKKGRVKLDLNGDGKFDKKDKSLAAQVLASKIGKRVEVLEQEPVEEVQEGDMVAVRDISRKYRSGSTVPKAQIDLWKKSGINYKIWFWVKKDRKV